MPSVERIALVAHGSRRRSATRVERVEEVARRGGRRGRRTATREADLVVVLGGDGTMLRALQRFLGTGVPVIGVNFGRVGFLTLVEAEELESGLARAFAGDFVVVELPTLEAEVGGRRTPR